MKSRLSTFIVGLFFLFFVLSNWSPLVAEDSTNGDSFGLSFRYDKVESKNNVARVDSGKISPVGDIVYIKSTFRMGPANPIRIVDGAPKWQPEEMAKTSVDVGTRPASQVLLSS